MWGGVLFVIGSNTRLRVIPGSTEKAIEQSTSPNQQAVNKNTIVIPQNDSDLSVNNTNNDSIIDNFNMIGSFQTTTSFIQILPLFLLLFETIFRYPIIKTIQFENKYQKYNILKKDNLSTEIELYVSPISYVFMKMSTSKDGKNFSMLKFRIISLVSFLLFTAISIIFSSILAKVTTLFTNNINYNPSQYEFIDLLSFNKFSLPKTVSVNNLFFNNLSISIILLFFQVFLIYFFNPDSIISKLMFLSIFVISILVCIIFFDIIFYISVVRYILYVTAFLLVILMIIAEKKINSL